MRFHVIGLPHTSVTKEFSACAYTDRIRKWCNMMTDRGHTVFLYAGPESEARCEEFIPCISETDRAEAVGSVHYTEASFDTSLKHWREFNGAVINAVNRRIMPHDFLCVTAGEAHQLVVNAFPAHITSEIMVGYGGLANGTHKVFESYAWMHAHYGAAAGNPVRADGTFFDRVIPPNFELDDYPVRTKGKGTHYLYLGRNVQRKGVEVVEQVCRDMNLPLVTAGPGGPLGYGEYRGVVGPKERGELLSNAIALFAPTLYLEPFGNVVVEAQLCGTPVITTDWGAFAETVEHGRTGFRCRTLASFKDAAEKVLRLDRGHIVRRARINYNSTLIGFEFEDHFTDLSKLWGKGWYQ